MPPSFHRSVVRHFERTQALQQSQQEPSLEFDFPCREETVALDAWNEQRNKQELCKNWVEMARQNQTYTMASWDGSIKYDSINIGSIASISSPGIHAELENGAVD